MSGTVSGGWRTAGFPATLRRGLRKGGELKIICAWCKRDLGNRRGGPKAAVTSGICDACNQEQLRQFGRPLQELIDELPAPVVIVGPDAEVLGANRRARSIGPNRLPRIDDRFGDMIGCVNAKTTGCGRSVCCQSCTIRESVKKTLATGKPCKDVPTYRDIEVDSRVKHLNLRVSTELRGKYVLVRIDKVSGKKAGLMLNSRGARPRR